MSLFRPSRERRGPDRYLPWKIGLFALAALLAFAGMRTGAAWLVALAMLALATGVALRFLPRQGG